LYALNAKVAKPVLQKCYEKLLLTKKYNYQTYICPMQYKDIFFDLDHTIWDFETNSKATLQELYITNNLHQMGIENFDLFFERYSFHNHKLWDRYTKGFIKQEELKWKRMWLALLDFKIANDNLSKKLSQEFLEILPSKTSVFTYTFEILNYLKTKNYNLHIITNGFEKVQFNKLKNSKLDSYFDCVITSEASNSLKPNVEIFNCALQKANATTSNSIMIGDNIAADIDGAKNAGLATIYVNHVSNIVYKPANYTVFTLQEIENIL
jgi:putative hydrolase of the HAD superfamily